MFQERDSILLLPKRELFIRIDGQSRNFVYGVITCRLYSTDSFNSPTEVGAQNCVGKTKTRGKKQPATERKSNSHSLTNVGLLAPCV